MLKLFGKKKAVTQPQSRSDGYRDIDFPIIQWFQATFDATHHDAVCAGLKAARDPNFVVTKQHLMFFINNEEWFNMGGSYE